VPAWAPSPSSTCRPPEWVSAADMLAEARRHAPGVEVFLSEDGTTLGV
jgi:hypothetical protein